MNELKKAAVKEDIEFASRLLRMDLNSHLLRDIARILNRAASELPDGEVLFQNGAWETAERLGASR